MEAAGQHSLTDRCAAHPEHLLSGKPVGTSTTLGLLGAADGQQHGAGLFLGADRRVPARADPGRDRQLGVGLRVGEQRRQPADAGVAGPHLDARRDVAFAVDAADQRATLARNELGGTVTILVGTGILRSASAYARDRSPTPSSATPTTISIASSAHAASAAPSRIRCGARVSRTLSFQLAGSPSVALTTTTVRRFCLMAESITAFTLRANGNPAPPRPQSLISSRA